MEFAGVDNIHIITVPSDSAIWGNAVSLPDATGFRITINDSGQSVIDPNSASLALKLDGTAITPTTRSKTGGETTFTFLLPAGTRFDSGSAHSVEAFVKDGRGVDVSAVRNFNAPNYVLIDPALAVTGVDKTKPGFVVRIHQSYHGLENTNDRTDRQIFGEMGANVADNTFFDANGIFLDEDVINYGGGNDGNFGSGAGFPDEPIPGIPSLILPASQTDNIGGEFITFIEFPAPGFYRMGVNSDDGFRTIVGKNPKDRWQVGGLVVGEFNGGRGASDTIFSLVVNQAGIYPFRTTWEEGGGGNNVEWFSIADDGTKILINDVNDPRSLKAYRQGPMTDRAYIASVRPGAGNGVIGVPGEPIKITIVDANTKVVDGTVKLKVNGAEVAATVSRSGNTTTVTYDPGGGYGIRFNTQTNVELSYDETTSPVTTRVVAFDYTAHNKVMPFDLPANSFFVEAEDFDFDNGQSKVEADDLAYTGGAYADLGAVRFVDFNNDDGNDSNLYRIGESPNVNMDSVLGNRWSADRPGPFGSFRQVTINHKIGWVGGGNWGNYSRTIPAGTYTAYAALSFDGVAPGQLNANLALVTAGAGTANQTLKSLGNFNARGSAGWGANDLVGLVGPDGSQGVFKLPGGRVTIRFNMASGDFDWFTLVPVSGVPPKVVAASPGNGAYLSRNKPIRVQIQDFDTAVNATSIKFNLDGAEVNATVNKNGDVTTVEYLPATPFDPLSWHTYTVSFSDNGTPARNFSVTARFQTGALGAPGDFVIEAEDMNYDSGKTLDVASVMPYLGGAYNGLGAVNGVDYVTDDGNDSNVYRLGETGNNIQITDNLNTTDVFGSQLGKDRGTWDMTANYRIGWIGGPDYFNYTRTFPAGDYNVYVALSFDGNNPGQLHGTLHRVTTDPTQPNQATELLGTFDAPGTNYRGGWGASDLVAMKDGNGNLSIVHLEGTQTLRYKADSGDFDYLAFVRTSAPPPPPKFTVFRLQAGNIHLEWEGGGTLEVSDSVTGPWVDTGLTSPVDAPIDRAARFGRVKRNN
ncbi:MAG: hypothetical protein AB1813_00070 [Verrucomicrobiota bacterium]